MKKHELKIVCDKNCKIIFIPIVTNFWNKQASLLKKTVKNIDSGIFKTDISVIIFVLQYCTIYLYQIVKNSINFLHG